MPTTRKKSHALQADSDKYRSLCRQMEEELMKLRGRACGSSSATARRCWVFFRLCCSCDSFAAGSTSATADNKDANKDAASSEPHHQQQQQKPQQPSAFLQKMKRRHPSQPPPAQKPGPAAPTPVLIRASPASARAPAEDRERKLFSENDLARKVRRLEETLHHCQQKLKHLQARRGRALLKEMEVMELAFSEPNKRERRRANLKLMNDDRQKGDKMRLLLQEEKDVLANQLRIIACARIEAQSQVAAESWRDKDRLNMGSISTLEKEVGLRQQALDIFKRRSAEQAQQQAQDLQLNLDKSEPCERELQARGCKPRCREKAAVIEKEGFRATSVFLEELATLKRKHDRLKKIEESSNADEVLLAEIADYKEQLTCPCCKVRRKDAILTKCFHVFCLDCLKTRYETPESEP
uniref:E3 ubiquitin protein ligase n=1 Tax=Macrostomum lignano TaxID=282301 RepID=A0A1I8F6A4_9PLAT